MTLKIPNAGEAKLLGLMLGKDTMEVYVLKLYSNNYTPAETDTAANFTELSGNGYAAINLTAASWTITAGDPCDATYPLQTFTFSGAAGNVYGYYIVGQTSGTLLWAEKFTDGPYNITAAGDTIKVTPKFQFKDTTDA